MCDGHCFLHIVNKIIFILLREFECLVEAKKIIIGLQ